MKLSAETQHLFEKRLRQAVRPIEVFGCALLATIEFVVAYVCLVFGLRYHNQSLAIGIVVACLALCCGLTLVSVSKWRLAKPSRAWIALTCCMWCGLAGAFITGDRYWYQHTVNFYNLRDMASYINIDPASDKGQSYMDAGTVYFKDGSYVLRDKALAFRNGLTYCVAPIVQAPLEYEPGSPSLETVSGFAMPRSGTVDFWAVGTDCCGKDGGSFSCGQVQSTLARSGLRLLDDTSRSMYLLAVQEWSASTGIPVRHPLFFHWVKDPVLTIEAIYLDAWNDFWTRFAICLFTSLAVSVVVHGILQALKCH